MSMASCPGCIATPTPTDHDELEGQTILLSVPGVKCAGCIQSIERNLAKIPGVQNVRVNLTMKRVSVTGSISGDVLVQELAKLGYPAYPFDIEQKKSNDDAVGKDLILRLGVAGFAMMNVMLLSVAVWAGATDATRDLFHLISAMIALPATFFAAQPFFKNAKSALFSKRLNMDVPISLAILLAASMSLYETLNGGSHAYFDAALSLTFFLLIGRVLEHQSRASARSAAEDLAALEVQTARIKTGDGYDDIRPEALKIGDEVLVSTGMRVPVDGKLLDETAFTDRSFLTGESEPISTINSGVLHAGEINIGPAFHLSAIAVGEDTTLKRMARLVETAENARNRYTSLADHAARIYAPAVHLLALGAFLVWLALTGDFRLSLNIAIAVLIITCPCALGLAVPAVATAAIGRLFHMGFLVKSGSALERLAETNIVVLDKTGTLTTPGDGFDFSALDDRELSLAKALALQSQHPLSRSVSQQLSQVRACQIDDVTEFSGRGIKGRYGDVTIALGQGQWLGAADQAFGLSVGDDFKPILTVEKTREGVKRAIDGMQQIGLNLRILSGDTPAKTKRLADALNLGKWDAGVNPEEKHQIINRLEQSHENVAMVGDGINDTAAMAAAHASIAPGAALDAARNAADVVILGENYQDLPTLFKISRMAVHLSRQNFAIAGAYNLIAIPIALAGFATPMLAAIAMSVSSLTVLINAMRVRLVK